MFDGFLGFEDTLPKIFEVLRWCEACSWLRKEYEKSKYVNGGSGDIYQEVFFICCFYHMLLKLFFLFFLIFGGGFGPQDHSQNMENIFWKKSENFSSNSEFSQAVSGRFSVFHDFLGTQTDFLNFY